MAYDLDDCDDPIIARRRRQRERARRRMLVWGGVGAGVVIVVLFVTVAAVMLKGSGKQGSGGASVFGPSRSDWTHKELLAHLKAKGMNIEMRPKGGSTAYLVDMSDPWWRSNISTAGIFDFFEDVGTGGCVSVTLQPSEQIARESAGISDLRWNWGRFVFRVNPDGRPFLEAIRRSLQ